MDKCPYCGSETRPNDNFCLNCGNRLTPAAAAQSMHADPTVGAFPDEEWGRSSQDAGTAPSSDYGSEAAPTAVGYGTETSSSASTAQATMDRIEQPGRFILRSESGQVITEYPLEKNEIAIGRAPNSDILLQKDKLTSRRHAVVRYENNQYVLHDEHSANGTFVNGQQLEENGSRVLQDGDHIGIGEHELIFRAYGSNVDELPTVSVPYEADSYEPNTYRTSTDSNATLPESDSGYETQSISSEENDIPFGVPALANVDEVPFIAPVDDDATSNVPEQPVYVPETPIAATPSYTATAYEEEPESRRDDGSLTFNRLTSLPLPNLPDLSSLMAAVSSLDGQIMSLQEQFNTTQEAMRKHEGDVSQTVNQLRGGIRRVAERMDSTIADVARSREALAWAELLQLMEDVMSNPRDIEYVTKLARKARELNKVFQIHQNVLNTMAECNSLLRGMIGDS
ncbi:FHA domain-containing protein [Ktedonospora formicarum]|uniref:FHA domain-containing protein n=1 Tax=Ktedonospora formicarum TaxID=2778364 RepID=A0A8J3HZJ1_9CHLR|nr:FHA domain-containing protein [Ktedonospora formicarum]GHO43383.1 hypothetical protein KSX_15460 [Ktedonospora formicarum]